MLKFTSLITSPSIEIERIILKEENYSILIDVEVPCIVWRMWGIPISSRSYRNSVIALLDCFIHFKSLLPKLQVVIDGTAVGGIRPADLEWASRWWASHAEKSGNTHFAIIMPQSTFGKVAMEAYLANTPPPWLEVKPFDNLESAKTWIRHSNNLTIVHENN